MSAAELFVYHATQPFNLLISKTRKGVSVTELRDYKPRHVVSIVLLLFGEAVKSGTDGELMNWRWFDRGSLCIESRHCRLSLLMLRVQSDCTKNRQRKVLLASSASSNFCRRRIWRKEQLKKQRQVGYGAHIQFDARLGEIGIDQACLQGGRQRWGFYLC